jgi:hypothetical protein
MNATGSLYFSCRLLITECREKCREKDSFLLHSAMSFKVLNQGSEMIIFELILTTFKASFISV